MTKEKYMMTDEERSELYKMVRLHEPLKEVRKFIGKIDRRIREDA